MLFLIGLLFVALVSIKPKPKQLQAVQAPWQSPPVVSVPAPAPQVVYQQSPQVSYREQQIDEFALLMATEYRRMKDEEQRGLARESLQIAEAYRKISEQQNAETIHAKAALAFSPKP
jgi:hypothetical protein